MARVYFGIDKGSDLTPSAVTIDTSTTSEDVELSIDDAVGLTKHDVDVLTQALLAAVAGHTTPIL